MIRLERPEDRPAVAKLLREAFGGGVEARLVDALRDDGREAVVDGPFIGEHLQILELRPLGGGRRTAVCPRPFAAL